MTTEDWARVESAFNEAYADGLRVHRLMRRWSQGDLANRLGVSRPAVGKMESGDRRATLADLYIACDLFGTDALDFLLLPQRDDKVRDQLFMALGKMFPEAKNRLAHHYL